MWADRNDGAYWRVLRSVWPGANPLRRRTDWFEPCAVLGVVLALALAFVVSIFAADAVLREQLDLVEAENATRHQITATVVSQVEAEGAQTRSVVVRWGEAPHEQFATVRVPAAAEAASAIPIWLDPAGQPVPPPKSRAQATQAAGTSGAGVFLMSVVGITLVTGGARWWVGRRRLAAWEAEWAWIEPQWRNHTT